MKIIYLTILIISFITMNIIMFTLANIENLQRPIPPIQNPYVNIKIKTKLEGKVSSNFGTFYRIDLDGNGFYDSLVIIGKITDERYSRDKANSIDYSIEDGSFYLAGSSGESAILLKLDIDGKLDTTFNGKGYIVFNKFSNNSMEEARSVEVSKEGKIYTLLKAIKDDRYYTILYRMEKNGSIDNNFQDAGKYVFSQGERGSIGNFLFIDQKGITYFGGFTFAREKRNISFLNILDPQENRITNYSGIINHNRDQNRLVSVYVDNNGKIYKLVKTWKPSDSEKPRAIANLDTKICIERLFQNRLPDYSFGDRGTVILDNIGGAQEGPDIPYSIYVYNNKIYITGSTKDSTNKFRLFVARLNEDGTLDNSFGTGGYFILNNHPNNQISEGIHMHFDLEGNLYVIGNEGNNIINESLIVIKLNDSGQIDTSFGKQGKLKINGFVTPTGKTIEQIECADICTDSQGNLYIAATAEYFDREENKSITYIVVFKIE
ncbi:MAG: hypothetical protein N2169_03090 [bacterium]|nr:hypothetical protein [bacterium]